MDSSVSEGDPPTWMSLSVPTGDRPTCQITSVPTVNSRITVIQSAGCKLIHLKFTAGSVNKITVYHL